MNVMKHSSGTLMPIQFPFHPKKAVEAAAVLLKLHRKPMQYLALVKMLYRADRLALERMDYPITGDHYVSMDYGPVLSRVYDLMKGKPMDNALPIWSEFISSPKDDRVELLQDPGNGELCAEEEDILQEVYQQLGELDPFQVADWTHDIPEWQDPHGSAIPIPVEEILKTLGKSHEEITEIQQEAIREAYLDKILND